MNAKDLAKAGTPEFLNVAVGVCREDNPRDVDEAYGPGTYDRLFPSCDCCGELGARIREAFDRETGPYDEYVCDRCFEQRRAHESMLDRQSGASEP